MKNLWSLLAVFAQLTNHVLAENLGVSERDYMATSNISLWEDSATTSYSILSNNIEQRSIRSFSSSKSWQYITRPHIKHPETSAAVQGFGNQQAVVLAESTSQCAPSTALAEVVTCLPVVDASRVSSTVACKTTFSETKGCDMKLSPSTTSITAATLTLGCAQDSCGKGGCGGKTKASKPSGVKCKDCTTSKGLVYAPQSTVPLSSAAPVANASPSLAPENGRSLEKRTLINPTDYATYDDFMIAEVNKARIQDNLVDHRPKGTGGRSSARIFTFFGEPQNFAVENLSGCTVVILVSRRGIWISHHWEDPTFVSIEGLPSTVEQDILVGMFTGDQSGYYPGMNQLSQTENLFDRETYGSTQNLIQPIIITPWVDEKVYGKDHPQWRHLPDILRIRELLHNRHSAFVLVFTYLAVDPVWEDQAAIFQTTARGKVLVQYDPQNWLVTENAGEGGKKNVCYEQQAVVRIWDDSGTRIYSDDWIATPDQNTLVQMQQLGKRGQKDAIDWSQPDCGQVNTTKTESACTITSAPATTVPIHTSSGTVFAASTVPADTYCQCGKTIAGIETKTGSDGSRSLYCNDGSKSHTKPDKTLPPASTCYITSAPATTMPSKTIGSSVFSGETFPAATYCQCGKTVAGIQTSTGLDGGKTFYCADGIKTSHSPVSHSPPPTACKLTSAPATTIDSQTFPENTYCQCGEKVVGSSTSTGKDGGATVFCAGASGRPAAPVTTVVSTSVEHTSSSAQASSSSHASTPSKVQVCHLHLYEATRSDQKPGTYELSGGSGVHLYVDDQERSHVETYEGIDVTFYLTPVKTGLEKNIGIDFGFVLGDDLPQPAEAGRVPTPNTADSVKDYTDYLVFVGYGNQTWGTKLFAGNNDTGHIPFLGGDNYPYCGIGSWDTRTTRDRPNRNLDCYFEC